MRDPEVQKNKKQHRNNSRPVKCLWFCSKNLAEKSTILLYSDYKQEKLLEKVCQKRGDNLYYYLKKSFLQDFSTCDL